MNSNAVILMVVGIAIISILVIICVIFCVPRFKCPNNDTNKTSVYRALSREVERSLRDENQYLEGEEDFL